MTKKSSLNARQPVVAIMGHVDHGKSTLLDAIRNTNLAENEVGGITQHISAYEVLHIMHETKETKRITFLDTPGHAAFGSMRESGARIADIAILVVSAEDGVMPQTIEAFKIITDNQVPCIVALTKVDKPNADIQKTKNSLIENGIYLEGMGGDLPYVETDSKTKKGLDELLETILLVSEINDFKYDESLEAKGFVLETILDGKRGITSTLIIKDGIMPKSGGVLADTALAPIRIVENFLGKPTSQAKAGQVVRVVGFDSTPEINSEFITNEKRNKLEVIQAELKAAKEKVVLDPKIYRNAKLVIPVILKADTLGTYSSVEKEIKKVEVSSADGSQTGIKVKIVGSGVGNITENDILSSAHDENILIIGFNVDLENNAKNEAERLNIKTATFQIIYKLSEWFNGIVEERLPHEEVESIIGKLKILKTFSQTKDKQVLGANVLEGAVKLKSKVKIKRRDFEIGYGRVVELQSMKLDVEEVLAGNQCGIMVESKLEIIPGDILEVIQVEKKKII